MWQAIGIRILSILLILPSVYCSAALSVGEIEVLQTQASLDFNQKKYTESEISLRKILAEEPHNVAALEMMALTAEQLGHVADAIQTYETLLRVGPTAKTGAYHFGVGSLKFREKQEASARDHLLKSARAKFNPGMSNFYLGVIDFNAKGWQGAKHHFTAALRYNDGAPIRPIARYYLAGAYAQLGRTDAAVHQYHEADVAIEEDRVEGDKTVASSHQDIRRNVLKELKSLDHAQRFLSLALISQWDGNVQTNPSEVNNPAATASQRSLKQVVNLSAGWVTSPVRRLQFYPSYRLSTNYNFNDQARDYNFITHTPGFYLFHRPYSSLSFGLKAEGAYSMKNSLAVTDSRSRLHYTRYSLTGDIGPMTKIEINPGWLLTGECLWRPKKYYTDPVEGPTRRSGGGLLARISSEWVTELPGLNPTGYFAFEWDHPSGTDYRMRAFGGGISNAIALNDRTEFTLGIDVNGTSYYETADPKRSDFLTSLRAALNHSLGGGWTLLSDLSFSHNDSTVATSFKYNRVLASAGASYNF